MNKAYEKMRSYLTDTNIDINERLGVFFINVGTLAAFLGIVICIASHQPVTGTIATALIALGSPLITGISHHTGHSELYGGLIAIMIIFMIPIVWLTTGGITGGTGFWFVYELFYISLFAKKKQLVPYFVAALLVMGAAITVNFLHPDWFFQITNRTDALVSWVGSGIVVTFGMVLTVYVQKEVYNHERAQNTKSQDMTRNFVTSIANTIDTKDPYTGGHSRRVAECSVAIAKKLGMTKTELDNMYFIALLHDIGKIGVPDGVLNKPGKLTDEEFATVKNHPVYGAEILKDVVAIPHVLDAALYHHERYDGKGYPEGLKGEEIPFVARIIAVADSYDAMAFPRIYRQRIKREEIIKDFTANSGIQFDPHIAEAFVEMLNDGFELKSAPMEETEDTEQK